MMPIHLRIKATLDDMIMAIGGDDNKCALAEWIKRSYPQLTHPHVGRGTIAATDEEEGKRYEWLTPEPVAEWLRMFDDWKAGVGPAPGIPLDFYLRREEAFVYPTAKARRGGKSITPESRRAARLRKQELKQTLESMSQDELNAREGHLAVRKRQRRSS